MASHEPAGPIVVIVTFLYGATLAFVHCHHEFWRDEMHCWIVGRNADGLEELLFGNRRYDGHPVLWYYLLYLVSRIVRGPFGLHAITVLLSTASTYLIFRWSGFPRFLRLSILPSFLWFYEYGVVSRSYTLGITLVCLFCALYRPHRPRYVTSAILLSLLALSSVYGTICAGVLALYLFTRGIALRRTARPPFIALSGLTRAWVGGILVLVLGALTIAISTRLPDDGVWGTVLGGWTTSLGTDNLRAALGRFWWAFVPTMDDWWSTGSLGSDLPSLAPWIPWLGGGLFIAFLIALRSSPGIVAVYALGVSSMALFQEMRYPGGMRHVGHFFILLLACGWLLEREAAPPRRMPIYWALLSFALVFQLGSTIRATRKDLREPFSSALEAADFLRPLLSDDARIIGSGDHESSPVAGYLDRWFVFAETGDHAYSVTFHNRRHGADNNVLFGLAAESLATGGPVFFVLNHPLDATSQQGLTATELHVTREAIVRDERYWIYRLVRTPP